MLSIDAFCVCSVADSCNGDSGGGLVARRHDQEKMTPWLVASNYSSEYVAISQSPVQSSGNRLEKCSATFGLIFSGA